MRVSDVNVEHFGHHICLYGPPKSGKTLAAAMVAREFNTYWFDFEHGSLTLKQLPLEVQRNIELIKVPDDRKEYLAITAALYLTEGKPVKICDTHGKIGPICAKCKLRPEDKGTIVEIDIDRLGPNDLVVFDSGTQLSHSAMSKALGGNVDIAKPEWPHYTMQGVLLDRVLSSIQKSPANWIYITHEEAIEQEDKSEKIVPMSGTRNFSRNVAKYFDHVVYCSIKNRQYRQNSDGTEDPKILTGSRTAVKLELGVTDGIISLLKSTRGSDAEQEAKEQLEAAGAPDKTQELMRETDEGRKEAKAQEAAQKPKIDLSKFKRPQK